MRLTGGEIIVETLCRWKVPYAIGIPGHGCLGLQDAFIGREDRIGIIQPKQEMAGVHIADGYFRISGEPLMVFTSIGPGAANTVIGAATCYVDSTAVLIVTGAAHTYMQGRGVLQEIERTLPSNFPRILEPVVKKWWQPHHPRVLPAVMRRAFMTMLSGRKGPVLIDLPMDVQAEAADVKLTERPKTAARTKMLGDPEDIDAAVKLLLKAKRPVILAGGGALQSEAWDELVVFAEHLGIPVATTWQGKSAFPNDHTLSAWLPGSKGTHVGNHFCSKADVLLAVGARFADETASSYKHGVSFSIPPTKLIHVDIDPIEIGKNYPVEIGIQGDAKAVLGQMYECALDLTQQAEYTGGAYFRELQQWRAKWEKHLAKYRCEKLNPPTISSVLYETRKALDRDAIVVTSSGNVQAQVLQEFPFYHAKTNLTTGGFSTMGWAFPAAIGAKLAAPNHQVVALVGDGDFMMTMQEMSTAVQHNIPVVVMLMNNMGWQAIADLQTAALGPDRVINTEFLDHKGKPYSPDFAAVAKNFGMHSQKIDKLAQVGPALKKAFGSGRPALIEVIVNRKYPYSGSPAVGWWDVPIPAYLKEKRRAYEKQRKSEKLI